MGKMHELLEKDGRKIKHADLESEIEEIRSNTQAAGAPAGRAGPLCCAPRIHPTSRPKKAPEIPKTAASRFIG